MATAIASTIPKPIAKPMAAVGSGFGAANGGGGSITNPTLVIWGDSTATQTAFNVTATTVQIVGNNWAQAGLHMADHPLTVVNVGGHSGMRIDQIIPTFSTDVSPFYPKFVIIPVGTNNIIQGLPAETSAADLQTMVDLVKSIGSVPIVMTVSCGETISGSGVFRPIWLQYNNLVRGISITNEIPLVDVELVYVNPATIGTTYAPLAGYTDGSVHPANKGAIKWGEAFRDWLLTLPIQTLQSGPNSFGNPLFTGAGGSLGGATGVAPNGTAVNKAAGTTTASSIAPRSDGEPGNWWQVISSGATSADSHNLLLGGVTGIAVGDRVRCMADVEVDSAFVNMTYSSLRLRFNGATLQFSEAFAASSAAGGMLDPFPKMYFRTPEIQVPVGTTSVQAYLFTANTANAPWSITTRVGGVYVTKL